MGFWWCVLSLLSAVSWGARVEAEKGCYKELAPPLPSYVIYIHQPQEDTPDHFDWREVVSLSPPTNQFLPSPCGSCWAHAAVGALTDRIIIARQNSLDHTPVIPLSSQVLLDCRDTNLGTCHGGSALGAYAFIKENGVTDETCSPYMGVDDHYWAEMTCAEIMCRKCDRYGTCKFVNSTKHYVSEYGTVVGETQMKAEIKARGPIACSVYAHSAAFESYTGGVIQDPHSYNQTTHVVVITGWGADQNGLNYWIGRNSFGSTWGEAGWFKLQRGVNALDIEKHPCAWAVPKET